ncbi:ATP-binding protein [Micromonospora sp. NPDC023956]|uniref:ATP-binding protein n=1 Tax=Micromonospora sp. NPDC023956 TaxID=3155722 RepID=UPI003407F433
MALPDLHLEIGGRHASSGQFDVATGEEDMNNPYRDRVNDDAASLDDKGRPLVERMVRDQDPSLACGDLGVLGDGDEGCGNVGPILSKLADAGLTRPSRSTRMSLTVAAMHASYLHENQVDFPHVTKGVLEALDRLGRAFFMRHAAVEFYKRDMARTVGDISKQVASVNNGLHSWANRQDWLAESALLGRSFEKGPKPKYLYSGLFRQILGAMCLAGEESVADRLVSEMVLQTLTKAGDNVVDAKTLLQEAISPDCPVYKYERSGPDHEAYFQSTVTDARGRVGVGGGQSKKTAAQQAALDFLRKYHPAVRENDRSSAALSGKLLEIPRYAAHEKVVRRVQCLFSLPATAAPLISQALIHSSWAYENRAEMQRCYQQDNKMLGFVGSCVLDYEYAFNVVRNAMASPPDEFVGLTMTNNDYASTFRQAGLAPGLLLGAGQKSSGISTEMGANAFQAVLAAVYVAKSFPKKLSADWPQEWGDILRTIAPPQPRAADATTLLIKALSPIGLEPSFEFVRSGPDHLAMQAAILTLESKPLEIRKEILGTADHQAKASAKHRACYKVLDILDRIGTSSPLNALADFGDAELSLARFLLAHQAILLATSTVPVQRWAKAQLFGLHLASSPNQLVNWAAEIDELLDSGNSIGFGTGRLAEAFRVAVENSSTSVRYVVDRELANVLSSLESVETPEEVGVEYVWRLVQLGDLYRCLGADEPDSSLGLVIDDWRVLHGRRLDIPPTVPMHSMLVTGRDRSVLEAAISAVLPARGIATVEIGLSYPLSVRLISDSGVDQARVKQFCSLWSGVSRSAGLEVIENGVEATIESLESPLNPGPIAQAVLESMRPEPDPFRGAVADLVHDLKNQVVAVRTALSQVGGSRTARLERQLAASRHLEHAQAIALRLRAATSMGDYSETENTELGAFLRQYGATVFARLPRAISMSIPDARSVAYVAISERALTAIFDNLVQNAVEAMRGSGSIRLDWLADSSEAVVEVRDDGPGLPAEVSQALATGSRIRTSKLGGNGLGLLGVHALLHRIGGQLSVSSSPAGTSWLITLPLLNGEVL